MAIDMKEQIAHAAKVLLLDKGVKKLTVKDIVEECRITRQTFYYHFEDIPDLLRWSLERESDFLLQDCFEKAGSGEGGIRYFLVIAVNTRPFLEKGMQSNYGEEIEKLLAEFIGRFFEKVAEEYNLFPDCSRQDLNLILRYHAQAVTGMLRNWTDADTKNVDHIAHLIYQIILGELTPVKRELASLKREGEDQAAGEGRRERESPLPGLPMFGAPGEGG